MPLEYPYFHKEIFHHIGSWYPINKEPARKIAKQIYSGLGLKNGTLVNHEEMKEYQQGNKFDCGLFVTRELPDVALANISIG